MDGEERRQERLTEFERVICYDTLPRVATTTTLSLIAGYTAVAIAAFLAMAYGVRTDNAEWRTWGTIAFAVIVVGGIIGFLGRSMMSSVRMRAALAEAQRVPDVESSFDELPSPFAEHTLMRYDQRQADGRIITDNRGDVLYKAVPESGTAWRLENSQGRTLARIDAEGHSSSFLLSAGTPPRFTISRDGETTGKVERTSGLRADRVEIEGPKQPAEPLVFSAGSLWDGDDLVGRVYSIRGFLYLDIQTKYLDDAVLAFYIGMLR